tara:strand:+ start:358 stop:651 length:294 start_codon:yes stop_codon:yes gene_type:complete
MPMVISVNKNERSRNSECQYPNTFVVRPRSDFRLLGSGISLSSSKTYTAIDAINQPNWESRGLVFVLDAEGDNPENPLGFLLDQHDYVVVDDDEVVA